MFEVDYTALGIIFIRILYHTIVQQQPQFIVECNKDGLTFIKQQVLIISRMKPAETATKQLDGQVYDPTPYASYTSQADGHIISNAASIITTTDPLLAKATPGYNNNLDPYIDI